MKKIMLWNALFLLMGFSMFGQTAPECGGKFYDTGGPDGEYSNNEDYSVLIEADDPANFVTINFLTLVVENGFDFLRIYDGDDASAPELTPSSGAQSPGTYTSTVAGGNLFVTFISDISATRSGWDADIICSPNPPCVPPTGLLLTENTETTATFTWNEEANATNGYTLSIYNENDDPTTSPPIYTEDLASGTTTATATGLLGGTTYTACIASLCDASETSNISCITFNTAFPPPVCGGKFYDTGGPDGEFQNNEDYTITILPENDGDLVTATFLFVENTTFDVLTVDVGDGVEQVVPEVPEGEDPVVYTSIATDGSLIFHFTSSGVNPNPGWDADITCGPPPTCDAPDNFMLDETTANTATFSWDEVPNATNGYVLSVFLEDEDPTTATPVSTQLIAAGTFSGTADGLAPATTYDAYIAADCDTDGPSAMVKVTFFTPPVAPVCGEKFYDTGGPDGDFQNNEDYTITITPDNEGDLVTATFVFVNNSDFDFLMVDIGDGVEQVVPEIPAGGTPISYTSIAPDGELIFHFVSSNIVPNPGWDADITCAPPSCPTPENFTVSNVTEMGADFSWDAVAEAADGYILGIFNDGDDPTVDDPIFNTGFISETTASVTDLEADTAYDVYLVSICSIENEIFSDFAFAEFTTTLLGVEDILESEFVLFPNPTTGKITFKSPVNIEQVAVYSILGNKVLESTPNTSNFEIDLTTLSNGTYFIRSTYDDTVVVKKVIKM
ncbi:fibronectin type III domain-containing protein [Cochleicola gelatinilyticus]|nr:fibronectin type III domain-containing protein [Cochleicola gelatinilyticus]